MPASPTLKELAARVAELEAQNERVAALGKPVDLDDAAAIAALNMPTRRAWHVVSHNSGAHVIGPLDDREIAEAEAERLNGEARKFPAEEAQQTAPAGMQNGELTYYRAEEYDVVDVDARRAILEEQLAAVRQELKRGGNRDRVRKAALELDRDRLIAELAEED